MKLLKKIWNNFHIHFRFQAAIFDFSLTPMSPCTNIPLCCSMQNIYWFGWNFTYISCAISALCVSGFTSTILISSWTLIELSTERCCYQQRWLQHPRKKTQQRWICFQRWFTRFDSMVTKFIIFSPKNHPPHFHFRWCNALTSWTISKISTSFHHALMALGIRESAMENSDGHWDIQDKRGSAAYAPPPPLFEG